VRWFERSQQPTLSACTLDTRLQRYSCVYSALSCTHVNPPGASRVCARARLLIYFDVSLRKLRAQAYPSLDLSHTLCNHLVFRWLQEPHQWRQEIRETSLSKVMRPQHFAVHRVPQVEIISDEFLRIYYRIANGESLIARSDV